MQKRSPTIAAVCAAQSVAVGVGVAWGLVWRNGPWSVAGVLAVVLLGGEGLSRLASRRRRISKPLSPWVCLGLATYAAWLMSIEAFLWYIDDSSFVRGVLLVLPFLLAMSLLVRAGAWFGVVGSALFFATALAMLVRNGCSRLGGTGFFAGWVS
jgi:hypothetical protein